MKHIRSLRLAAWGALAAAAIGLSIPSAQAQSSFSFGFSDRGGGFSLGVNDGRYRPYYGHRGYYGPRYYPPRAYYGYDPYWRDPWVRHHRVRVYDPVYDRYVWVWR
ncbi:MAG: hypothetical protein ACYCZX_13005 [Rhodospirillaceae bacterium]